MPKFDCNERTVTFVINYNKGDEFYVAVGMGIEVFARSSMMATVFFLEKLAQRFREQEYENRGLNEKANSAPSDGV